MAVDTRDKRSAVIGYGLAFVQVFPDPDGTLDEAGDRVHLAYLYRGITPGGPEALLGNDGLLLLRRRRRLMI